MRLGSRRFPLCGGNPNACRALDGRQFHAEWLPESAIRIPQSSWGFIVTQSTYNKPVPMVTPENERYWQGCKQHELWMRYCNQCQKPYYYPRDVCPMCGSRDVDWKQMSGKGKIHTYAIVQRAPHPGFRNDVPYVTAIVELDEGPRMMTNVVQVQADPDHVKVGMPVQVTFEDITDQISLPKFRPA